MFAATTFWFLNALNENYSTTLSYPLRFVYDHEHYIAVDELPDNIQVNVSGLGWNLFRNSLGIKVTPLRIVLDNPTEVRKITGAGLPALISDQMSEVQLNYVLTDTLYVNIDEKIRRSFPIKIDSAHISLEKNYRINNSIRYTPDSVILEGPQSIISGMPDTLAVNIPQTGIDDDYKEDVPVNTPNNTLIKRNPPTVNVTFGVEEFVKLKANVPLKAENFPENGLAYIEANDVPVEFFVAQSKRDQVKTEDFTAIVDYNELNKGDSTLIPALTAYPGYARDVSIDTTRIKVHFNEK